MPLDLLIATRNRKKLAEIKTLLADLDFSVLSIEHFPNAPDVVEDGQTFEENAQKKAVQIAKATGKLTLADDSGLEIDYLDGQPGVLSARFAGENATDEDRNKKVLKLMEGVPAEKRRARFKCAIAIANSNSYVQIVTGKCEGEIAFEPKGNQGFGYDPLFIVPEYGKTYAELGMGIKNQISHRALALKKAKELLRKYLLEV